MIDALASFHAWWWDHEALDQVRERPVEADYVRLARELESRLPRFLDFLGDRLSTKARATYEFVVPGALPLLAERELSGHHLTLVHGDAHFWNVLLPRDPDVDRVLLIDWDDCQIAPGALDIAYAIGLHWYPERRARLEMPLLRRYHAALLDHGVSGYGWDDLLDDYRLFALRNLLISPTQWATGLAAYIWWGNLERALLTAEDLGALELL
jgi:thiamine kinase-like enzyme